MTFKSEIADKTIENQSTAILLFDASLRLICLNPAAEDMLSVSSKRVDGMMPQDIWPRSTFFSRILTKTLPTQERRIERGALFTLNNNRKIRVDCTITPIMKDEKVTELMVELIDSYAYERVMQEINQKTLQEAAKEASTRQPTTQHHEPERRCSQVC